MPIEFCILNLSGCKERYLLALFKQKRGWDYTFTIAIALLVRELEILQNTKRESFDLDGVEHLKTVASGVFGTSDRNMFLIIGPVAQKVHNISDEVWHIRDIGISRLVIIDAIIELAIIAEYIQDDETGDCKQQIPYDLVTISPAAQATLDMGKNPIKQIDCLIEEMYTLIFSDQLPKTVFYTRTIRIDEEAYLLGSRQIKMLCKIAKTSYPGFNTSETLDMMICDWWLEQKESSFRLVFSPIQD